MALLDTLLNDPPVGQFLGDIVTRMADEGIPLHAIVRSTALPVDSIRRVLHEAMDCGKLTELPREDWPSSAKRAERVPDGFDYAPSDEEVITQSMRIFHTTRLQSRVLALLLRRREATKEMIHHTIELNRQHKNETEATDMKMVDVVICLLRKKMVDKDITIKTLWGRGYYVEREAQLNAYYRLFPNCQPPAIAEAA